jgi:hypothetical protein
MIFAADKVKVIAPHQAMKTSGRVQQWLHAVLNYALDGC